MSEKLGPQFFPYSRPTQDILTTGKTNNIELILKSCQCLISQAQHYIPGQNIAPIIQFYSQNIWSYTWPAMTKIELVLIKATQDDTKKKKSYLSLLTARKCTVLYDRTSLEPYL